MEERMKASEANVRVLISRHRFHPFVLDKISKGLGYIVFDRREFFDEGIVAGSELVIIRWEYCVKDKKISSRTGNERNRL
jgi:hypothetical protein